MKIFKPWYIVLPGALVFSIPWTPAQAATFFNDEDMKFDQPVVTQMEFTLDSNTMSDVDLDLKSITSGLADDFDNGRNLIATNELIDTELEVAQEIPEPSTLVTLLFLGLFPKLCGKKK
ncbi:hypothetical protein [Lyngbya sp. PCC 8106]|uniref:hypothetical protein n=1 Tax=Lyngbya sp. (strain PCC 8106) TaxID=313612 RepID=UPI0000EAD14A|nr:hypothetical protein [Lyngbya sp. PCC 8106]EAW38258.1 hypothetical protein L8106_09551 [Lyngbya sp. PCC 8106]